MPLGCTIDLNHDHNLLLRTLVPLAILVMSMSCRYSLSPGVRDRIVTYNFIIFYLLFPSNSAAIFATLQCETFEDHPDQPSFLRSDFSVDCNTLFHQGMMVFAVLMIFVYPFGIPALYTYLLHKHRKSLWLLRGFELERSALDDRLRASKMLSYALAHVPGAQWASRVSADASTVQDEISALEEKKAKVLQGLPDYVQKLILGCP